MGGDRHPNVHYALTPHWCRQPISRLQFFLWYTESRVWNDDKVDRFLVSSTLCFVWNIPRNLTHRVSCAVLMTMISKGRSRLKSPRSRIYKISWLQRISWRAVLWVDKRCCPLIHYCCYFCKFTHLHPYNIYYINYARKARGVQLHAAAEIVFSLSSKVRKTDNTVCMIREHDISYFPQILLFAQYSVRMAPNSPVLFPRSPTCQIWKAFILTIIISLGRFPQIFWSQVSKLNW
jgi:hypothetical protein